ncbi:metabotropic glutamate receptor-like protein P [Glossina fuscipes]|uniref:Metabotropic glutamate receptor-like protein P n=1 Tax=Glossina fuscipes TaxID=7396 RepID=A0A9C5Z308_9MUSC|nr:metabotropic glutamate receptor-like protein P [Glossina fuscipes]KAI9588848.1 hypothetical protein GQX74_007017 [Glossina fuscipes]
MVAIEHRSKSSTTTLLSPSSTSSTSSNATAASVSTSSTKSTTTITVKKMTDLSASSTSKSAINQRQVDAKITKKSHKDPNPREVAKRGLKLDLTTSKDLNDYNLKSPKSPIVARLPHQTSLTSSTDVVEDRKTLREALYQGIFHRHRRTIFAVGSFLRMLRSRNSQYNTIRSSSEAEDEVR